jgi:SAM-dependent methyltransferase|tara:strand:- start:430 stop:1272 length:843 start_codon:yes stop_codon:yes gene_type:complete
VILDQFKKRLHPSQSGTWLDYGCGQGHLLSECARRYPNLVLIGVDESQKSREYIEHIKNATFISNIEDCDQRLDIVSMVHVLEHLESPVKILSKLKEKMKEDALLLIQIPTFVRNPFDLIIFDHGMFFTKKTISALLETAGFRVCTFARAVSQKEITVVARKSTARLNRRSVTSRDVKLTEAKLREGANYLSGLRDHAQLKASGGKVQIFGSSIGACWLFNELGTNNVACFLDEDSERVGNIFLGKEIRPFAQKNIDRTVFPLDPETKDQVIRRLQATKI